MKKNRLSIIFIVVFLLLAFPISQSFVSKAAAAGGDWEQLLADAKKEGRVVIGSSAGPNVREAIKKPLKDKYGIEAEFVTARPLETYKRISAERRAGLYTMDVMLAGTGTIQKSFKPDGFLESLDSVIILPEVLDGKNWIKGEVHWVDKEHFQLAFLYMYQGIICINSTMVKPDEITSMNDLLDPKWKGKIVFNDPSTNGMGNGTFYAILKSIMDLDYLKQLAKQDLIIERNQRLQVEWIARGKYPILIGSRPEVVTEFKQAGAPLGFIIPKEGSFADCGPAGISQMTKAPHPNASRFFINWLLSKEGQTVVSQAFGGQSARLDVSADHVDPDLVIKPGAKVYDTTTAEVAFDKGGSLKIAKETFNIH